MDEQLPIDDIRIVEKLLSKPALARIEAVKAEATDELLTKLSRYWDSVALDAAAFDQHDPTELIPMFERYAERQYDAYAKELLPHSADFEKYTLYLAINVTDAISNEIRPPRGIMTKGLSGKWEELVRVLKDSEPESREELQEELSNAAGIWEVLLERSFQRLVLKNRNGSWGAPERTKVAQLNLFFRVKFQLYLRLFPNWTDFDLRLRAHLVGRRASWIAQALRRAAGEDKKPSSTPEPGVSNAQPPSTSPDDNRPEPPFDSTKKGSLALLQTKGGDLKHTVTVKVACQFGGVGRRAIERAVRKGSLESQGERQKRKVIVQSLLKYFPP